MFINLALSPSLFSNHAKTKLLELLNENEMGNKNLLHTFLEAKKLMVILILLILLSIQVQDISNNYNLTHT